MKQKENSTIKINPAKLLSDAPEMDDLVENNQQSAKKAIKILSNKKQGYFDLDARQKKNLITVFASNDKIIYGKAFDIIKVENDVTVNFLDLDDIERKIKHIVICEIKSTRKKMKKDNFEGYFFGLTTAELLVAQNLKDKYRFVFVNINTQDVMELTLRQIFGKAKGIYPQWSISF